MTAVNAGSVKVVSPSRSLVGIVSGVGRVVLEVFGKDRKDVFLISVPIEPVPRPRYLGESHSSSHYTSPPILRQKFPVWEQ